MASCTKAIPRKRAPSDTFGSSLTNAKCPRIASTCPPPIPGPPRSDTTDSNVKPDPSESQWTSPSASSSAHTSNSTLRHSPDPFPRYSLGIPHLDVLLPFGDGLDLLHAYHQGIGWIYTPVDRTTLLETLEEAERHGADSIHPHRLACLLAALALGDLFSHCFPASSPTFAARLADTQTKRSRIWFGVASACLAGCRSNAELMQNPTPDACSALYLMSTYLLCSNDEELFHRSQGLTSLALILAKSALLPSCAASAEAKSPSSSAAPSVASQHQAATDLANPAASPSSQSSSTLTASVTCQDRLNCHRLLTDLVFHLRCQALTFALPSTLGQSSSHHHGASPASLVDVPTVQAIWTAFSTPLYASLDAFGSRYSPNIFHNWKLGLADLMHQVILTSQPESLQSCRPNADGELKQRTCRSNAPLPDHGHLVKLDERIRRYHASLPDFLLLHKPLPFEMAGKVDEDELAQIICQRHMACSMVHRMLMALHRPWFLSALTGRSSASPLEPKGAQQVRANARSDAEADTTEVSTSSSAIFSLSAVLRSATWQTETYASATACAPPQALAWWQLTNNALAAAIVQATALLRLPSPSSSTVESGAKCSTLRFYTQVRADLDKNVCSFQNVAKRCKLAAKALPFLQRVRSAIDSGICRSRHACNAELDILQASTATSKVCDPASPSLSTPSPSTSITDNASPKHVSDPLNCINTNIVTSNSIDSNNSNSNLSTSNRNNSKSNNNNNTTTTTNSDTSSSSSSSSSKAYSSQVTSATSIDGQNVSRPEAPHIPEANKAAASADKRSRPASQGRRGSSAKSELETIFGPIASGLELSEASAPPVTVKPLYRQSWEPIPVPSSVVHEGEERSTQAPSSDDAADSSASSSTCPQTPKSTTPRLGATNASRDDTAMAYETEAAADRKKTSDAPSDLVLDCIRFWQPDMLALAP
ncbi:hypothetical protein PHSY_002043 [Pseudozyma hubeiensis SY62]|uniref:Uncharacterized protein n=1 Tax=Pseudozyma hubeiensis (strain SY62) TaxID=1305764 RepID=R9P033_PSEHS|nr:hypothetical protein PHSY_002043 [Pseudozyma hubeiensis SY62]GAC94471.1 hypothetical protein PHSY_002043 [Pseudozyma hubeiensis SY62]